MSDSLLPVYVQVRRADGTTERVQVGTAAREGDGFTLQLGALSIGSQPAAAPRPAPASGTAVFPPYGRSKGMPIAGASMQDLEYYAAGCHRTLEDPGKARWHDKERALLAAIEAEIARQRGGGAAAPRRDEGPPPLTDDDIPF